MKIRLSKRFDRDDIVSHLFKYIVQQELDLLEDESKTYKLVGPALIKIELKEAKNNINVRMTYIQDEL